MRLLTLRESYQQGYMASQFMLTLKLGKSINRLIGDNYIDKSLF